jgi:hypothetical protein
MVSNYALLEVLVLKCELIRLCGYTVLHYNAFLLGLQEIFLICVLTFTNISVILMFNHFFRGFVYVHANAFNVYYARLSPYLR